MKRLWAFGAAVAVELAGVAMHNPVLQWIGKPLLGPTLIWHLRHRLGRFDLVALGLLFCTAGDIALLIRGAFILGMAAFFAGHVSFIVSFLRHRKPPWWAAVLYAAVWIAGNAVLWGGLGPLRIPVLIYSLALAAMAATSAGVSGKTALGGALFVISDLLIGLRMSRIGFPGHDLAVMVTYSAALFLIATGWTSAVERR
jgi:uncharacterized membrane protein YhhN